MYKGTRKAAKTIRENIIAAAVLIFIISGSTLQAALPRLHADGNQIKDPDGNVVVLRGISMIDLGFTESWHGGAVNMLNRLTNTTDAQSNSPGWHPKVIRIPITPPDSVSGWPYPFNPNNDTLYNLLRTVVDYLAAKDIYAIIDWHYVANTYDHVESTSQFWAYMAPRFANDAHVIFELFNEPINDIHGDWIFNSNDTADWLSVRSDMQTWINIVRTYAPHNLILAGGAFYCQLIGPAADYPLSDPVGNNNIAIVSHIYPAHWRDAYWSSSYKGQITACHTAYPIMMTEWGFSSSYEYSDDFDSTIADYGQPLMEFLESMKIGSTAWCASYNWGPPMFYSNWTVRTGEGEMGGFVKDTLYLKRNSDQPGGPRDTMPPDAPTSLRAVPTETAINLDWDNNVESDFYGYNVYRRQTADAGYIKLNTAILKSPSYTDDTVIGGITYYYAATALDDSANESDYSAEIAARVQTGMGAILREWWSNIGSGTSVSNLTSNINYPNNPTGRELLTQFEGPTNWDNSYGTRIRGYLYPPATGSYTFWIAGDDNCQLWLSTDGTPAHSVLIAQVAGWTNWREWNKYPSQQSPSIFLTAGKKYYIEALHKEGSGGDNIAAAWSGPGIAQQVISGRYLSPWLTGLYGDFISDSFVSLDDLAEFVQLWLNNSCVMTSRIDRNGDCTADFYEFALMADNWLKN